MKPEGQAGQTSKALGMRIIKSLRETLIVNGNEVLIGSGTSGDHPLAVPP